MGKKWQHLADDIAHEMLDKLRSHVRPGKCWVH